MMKKDSPTMTAAELLVRCLENEGVKYIFGIPGEENLDVMQALRNSSIQFITTRHEQGAAFMADVYGRLTGKAGVCLSTLGPGATNLVTGIATAYLDSVPLVAITGNVPNSLIGRDSFQEVDITGVTMPITKHNFLVKHVEELADTIREAFRIAKSGRPGPVLVDIPKDVQNALYE